MSSKKFQNRMCVYCTSAASTTADHVIARQFVPETLRGNLPKVPACQSCNNAKSQLEHYLAAVLPFASRTKESRVELTAKVPKRLAKNIKLHQELEAGRARVWTREASGIIVPTMAIPFDGEKLNTYVGYAVRGLMWHHWQVMLDADHAVEVMCLTQRGESFFNIMSGWNSRDRVEATLAGGVLSYVGQQGIDKPEISVWTLTFFNGLKVTGSDPNTEASRWGVMTGPRTMMEAAERAERALASRYTAEVAAPLLDWRPR